MPNEDKGRATCPFCKTDQPVRKNAKQKFYFNCSNCGVIQPALPRFQEWIMEHATLYGPEGKPEPEPDGRPAPPGPGKDTNDAPRATDQGAPPTTTGKARAPTAAKSEAPRRFGMFR